jgi:predicted Zn-dependent peptidase
LNGVLRLRRSTEKVKLVSKMCHSLIKQGTDKYTGYEVAEYFDFYGSELNQNAGVDFSSLSFFCLGTYFRPLFDRFIEVVVNPLFRKKNFLF